MDTLFNLLNSIKAISLELQTYISEHVQRIEFKKKEKILCEGEICKGAYFIEQGLVYSFYCLKKNDKENEVCNWIYQNNDVIISVYSFYQQKASYENIVCLEDTIAYLLTIENLMFVYEHFSEFNYIGRVLTQKYYLDSELRLYSLRKKSSKERYANFVKSYPNLIQKVPLQIIASFLGMDNATLSRIRGK